MKSTEFLQAALDVQKERGEQYDKPNGERSMAATVSAFNCITGYTLEESDGWMFMALLKLVRQAQNPEKYQHDSALDLVAYSSLYAEAASEQCKSIVAVADPIWRDAPEGATHYTAETQISLAAFWRESGGKFIECWLVEPDGITHLESSDGYYPSIIHIQKRPGA